MPYVPRDWVPADEVTSAALDRIELALADVVALAESLSATVSGLSWADIAAGPTLNLRPLFVFKTTDPATARPAVASTVSIMWDLGVDATTPPVNMGPNDYWLS